MKPRVKIHRGKLEVTVHPDGRVEMMAQLTGELFKQNGMWVSFCPTLDLSTCGHTRKEAVANTREAVRAFFSSCLEHGTLNAALAELKWTREDKINLDGLVRRERPAQAALPAFMIDKIRRDGTWLGEVRI